MAPSSGRGQWVGRAEALDYAVQRNSPYQRATAARAPNSMPACDSLGRSPAHHLWAVAVRVGDERGRSIGSLQGRRHADRGVARRCGQQGAECQATAQSPTSDERPFSATVLAHALGTQMFFTMLLRRTSGGLLLARPGAGEWAAARAVIVVRARSTIAVSRRSASGCFIPRKPAMPSHRTHWLTCSLPFPIGLQPTSGRTYRNPPRTARRPAGGALGNRRCVLEQSTGQPGR